MKKTLLLWLVSLFAAAASAGAADDLRSLQEKMAASRVSFAYSYEAVRGSVVLKGSGTVVMQGRAFRMEGNGMEVVSDGKVRWTADAGARELYIEAVSETQPDFVSNPARLLAESDKVFRREKTERTSFLSRAADGYVLVPAENTGLRRLVLFFSEGTLIGAAVTSGDGTVTEFAITDLAFSEPGTAEEFRYDEKSLDNSWFVTDLR